MGRPWRSWRYDLANTGHTLDSGPEKAVQCRWDYDAQYYVPGTPVVADGTVHVATQTPALSRSNVHGIGEESGRRRYVTPKDDPHTELRGSPSVVDSIAYVTVHDYSPLVRGYDTDTGKRVRDYDVGSLSGECIPPILYQDTLYCTTDFALTAAEETTGEERWSFVPGEQFYGSAAFTAETLFVGSAGENSDDPSLDTGDDEWPHARRQYPRLRALDAETGEVKWKKDLGVVPRTVAVEEETVFCCGAEPYSRYVTYESPALSDGGLPKYAMVYALSVDGEPLWTAELDARVRSAPAVADGIVLIGTETGEGDDARALLAFDATTGERLWKRRATDTWTAAVVASGIVYAGNADGFVDALTLADGTQLWRFDTEAGVYGPPSVSGGRVFVGDGDGIVYRLEERA